MLDQSILMREIVRFHRLIEVSIIYIQLCLEIWQSSRNLVEK